MQPQNTKHNVELNEIAAFDVTGDDAVSFLQGQLTQDVTVWQPKEIKRAAWCNAKGRMLATFYLWQIEGGFRMLLARDLAAKVLPRLRMFLMRAKVKISEPLTDPLFAFAVTSTSTTSSSVNNSLPALSHDGKVFQLLDHYAVTFDSELFAKSVTTTRPLSWTTAHTQAGVAWVSLGNTEQFVPQTANFELVGGVNFRKGCYPGQEVVARSQYLGKLKLRAAIARINDSEHSLVDLQDVFESGKESPIGRIIQASDNWALFQAPQSLIEAGAALCAGSPTSPVLSLQSLPYPVLDITA